MSAVTTSSPGRWVLGTKRQFPAALIARDVLRLLKLYEQAAPKVPARFAGHVLLGVLAAIIAPYAAKRIIDAVNQAQGQAHPDPVPALVWIGVELVIFVAARFASFGEAQATAILQNQGVLHLMCVLHQRVCGIPYAFLSDAQLTHRLLRAYDDIPRLSLDFALRFVAIVGAALVFIGSVGLVVTAAPWALPIMALSAIPQFLTDVRTARRLFVIDNAHLYRHRQGPYIQWQLTTEGTAKEVRALTAGNWFIDLFRASHTPYTRARVALAKEHTKWGSMASTLSLTILYCPYVYAAWQAVYGQISVGHMVLLVMAFRQGSTSLHQLLASLSALLEQHPHARAILDLLDLEGEQPATGPDDRHLLPRAPEVVFDDVWFTYPESTRPVLRGLTLRVQAGETVAVLGRNGMGKTTMIKILLGLQTADRGRLLLGGVDVNERPLTWRRDNIAVVFQDFGRYHFSVLDNVGLGWCTAAEKRAEVSQALQKADAQRLVDSLPHGMDTTLGMAFGGQDISGGEWQRIALARLFMRKSRVWVLDEPTAAMDPQAEAQTFLGLRDAAKDRTVIFITHRVASARLADRIAVMDDGRIVEFGTHEELLAQRGSYSELFAMQARAFSDHGQHLAGLADRESCPA